MYNHELPNRFGNTFREHTRILHGVKELSLNDMMELWIASKVDLKESTLNGYRRIYEIYVKKWPGKKNDRGY